MPGPFDNQAANCGLIVLGVACLLVVILVPMSFGDLEYYEMGFTRNKATGEVDTSKVYYGGMWVSGGVCECVSLYVYVCVRLSISVSECVSK